MVPTRNMETLWKLQLFINGERRNDSNYLSVFLLNETGEDVRASFKFSILDTKYSASDNDAPYAWFSHLNSNRRGVHRFVNHDFLPSLLPNDNLTINSL